MPKRDWRQHTPVRVGLAVVILLVLSGLANQYKETERAERTSKYEYEVSKKIGPMGVADPKRPYTDPKAYRDEWRAERDLAAQESMAYWTMIGALATAGGILILGFTLWDSIAATRAATSAVEVQIRIEQPYFFVKAINIRIGQLDDEYGFDSFRFNQISLVAANVGKGPGILTEWSIQCEIMDDLPGRPLYSSVIKLRGRVVGGDEEMDGYMIPLSDEQANAIYAQQKTVYVWGYFLYEDIFDRLHRTGFGFVGHPHCADGPDGPGPYSGVIWGRAGGKAYNYDREEGA